MAYFAELDADNNVVNVAFLHNILTMTDEGEEDETIGAGRLPDNGEGHRWLRCSWNMKGGVHARGKTPFRANYPGSDGWCYNEEHDIFHRVSATDDLGNDCPNHTLNTTTGLWEAPLPEPELTDEDIANGSYYYWDQSAYESDNTTGWIKVEVTHTIWSEEDAVWPEGEGPE